MRHLPPEQRADQRPRRARHPREARDAMQRHALAVPLAERADPTIELRRSGPVREQHDVRRTEFAAEGVSLSVLVLEFGARHMQDGRAGERAAQQNAGQHAASKGPGKGSRIHRAEQYGFVPRSQADRRRRALPGAALRRPRSPTAATAWSL